MSLSLKAIRTSPDLEENGVEIPYQGAVLRIGRGQSSRHRAAIAAARVPFDARLAAGESLTDAEWRQITDQALSRSILLGWSGLEDDDGKPLDYSENAAFTLLSDPELHDLRDFIVAVASSADNFRKHRADAIAGN